MSEHITEGGLPVDLERQFLDRRPVILCRTCMRPLTWETRTEPGFNPRQGWYDDARTDPLICFSAVDYRHVPLTDREWAYYEAGRQSVTAEPHRATTRIEWAVQKRCYPVGVGIRLYEDDEAGARAAAPKVIGTGAYVLCRTVVEYAPRVTEWRVAPPAIGADQ